MARGRGGRLSKNVTHHGWSTTKTLKKALDKTPQRSPPILKYYFSHTTFLYSSARSSGHDQYFFLISDFLAESLKVKSKTSEKDHTFYNTVSLKKPHSYDEPQPQ